MKRKSTKNKENFLFRAGEDWSFELINKTLEEIRKIAVEELRLDYYPNQIEVITAEQMIDAYASTGLPIMYNHWSFGKEFLRNFKYYKTGQMGLAYEIVINSNPCISYLMEENNMTMQALVMAHACFGHNAVFKNNYMFKQWTDAEAIIDYLRFAKNYIAKCEERYGEDEVESVLDSCHALMDYGVDKYKRGARKIHSATEEKAAIEKFEQELSEYNDLWEKTVPKKEKIGDEFQRFPSEPQENLLYFIEKNAPMLPNWKRELIRIVRKISQYFYPQAQTKVLNEGFASFTHYYIMSRLYQKGLIDEGSYMEFLASHTNVVFQPEFDKRYYSGLNPYALGFAIFMDIKRICEEPTEEDTRWFPELIGKDWVDAVQDAMKNYKDDSFIAQFLSPKVIRDFKLFRTTVDEELEYIEISAIHDDEGYREVRQSLSEWYNRSNYVPELYVWDVDIEGDRSMFLQHVKYERRPLDPDLAKETLVHVANLWEFNVCLASVEPNPLNYDDLFMPVYTAIGKKGGKKY